jgi:hypothetical protein
MISRLLFIRRAAFLSALALTGIGFTLSASARSATEVTFPGSTPWVQEVGSIKPFRLSHDYTVKVKSGNTFQINLIARNPNLYFKVKNQTANKQLVDTYETGATTWSTKTTSAATYQIRVYAQPDTLPRGQTAKYALQIGQYGPQNMQVVPTKVTFAKGKPWVQTAGKLDSKAAKRDYTIAVGAGKMVKVNLVARNSSVHFKVANETSKKQLVDTASTDAKSWSTTNPSKATYKIEVYVDPAAVPPGKQLGYVLQIGHFPGAGTSAGAGSAGSTAPAAAAPASARSTGF